MTIRAASDQVESLHPVMARLDRAIGINAAERAMARSGRAMTGLHVNLVGNRSKRVTPGQSLCRSV